MIDEYYDGVKSEGIMSPSFLASNSLVIIGGGFLWEHNICVCLLKPQGTYFPKCLKYRILRGDTFKNVLICLNSQSSIT